MGSKMVGIIILLFLIRLICNIKAATDFAVAVFVYNGV